MVKYFCDVCSKEIPAAKTGRVIRQLGPVKVEIMTSFKGVSNSGHICEACVIRAVVEGTTEQALNYTLRMVAP
jgi:hypothetical protein